MEKGIKAVVIFIMQFVNMAGIILTMKLLPSHLTSDEADNFEKLLINKLDLTNPNNEYNLESGGNLHKELSEETKQKISLSHIGLLSGERNPMYGITPQDRMDNKAYIRWEQQQIDLFQSDEFREKNRERNLGKKYSDEINAKKGRKGQNHPMYGQHFSDEIRNRMSELRKGKPVHTEESKRKISEAMKGENNPFYGKHHSEESKKKMSESRKGKRIKEENYWYGKHLPEEVRKKISKSKKGKQNKNSTMIIQCDMQNTPLHIFDYMGQAAERLNINRSCIGSCCRGNQKKRWWL